jgi:hypothetical protein
VFKFCIHLLCTTDMMCSCRLLSKLTRHA